MISDEELKKDFQIFVDKDGIINLISVGVERGVEDITRSTEIVEETLLKIFNENPDKKYKMFFDLSKMGNLRSGFSSSSRKIGVRIALNEQIEKVAVLQPSVFFKVIINFIINASGRGKIMKLFSDEEKALSWLKNSM